MNISSKGWSLTLDLNGGRINELSYEGIKVLGTYNRIDGKAGNSHLCIPSFDKEGQEKYGLPFHGLVRNTEWFIKNESASSITLSCETLSSDTYPAQLFVEQEFALKDDFYHTVRVANIFGKDVPVNIAYHYYWDTPSGWETTKLNGQDMTEKIKTNGYSELEKDNLVVFPHAAYRLQTNGLETAVLWTSFKKYNQENKQFSNDFCCIEPVVKWPHYFGSKESILHQGETISASVCLRKVV